MKRALVFDSGIGGLSVSLEIRKLLPELSQIYVADDAFRPYGDKTEAQLRERLPGLLATLEHMALPDVIVIACNTASVTALDEIRAAVRAPVIGVVPAIKPAAAISRTKTIAVLGTPGTVKRHYVDDLIHRFAGDCHVLLCGSVGLVQMAEDKLSGRPVDPAALEAEIAPLFGGKDGSDIDAVVLACTHFPLLGEELRRAVHQTVHWIDSGQAIARRVQTVLGAAAPRGGQKWPDTALLIGPDAARARRKAFADFGFTRVVGLCPAL